MVVVSHFFPLLRNLGGCQLIDSHEQEDMCDIREIDRIVELCKRDLAFIWLMQVEQSQRDAFL